MVDEILEMEIWWKNANYKEDQDEDYCFPQDFSFLKKVKPLNNLILITFGEKSDK